MVNVVEISTVKQIYIYIYTYTTTLRVIRRLGEGREDPKRVRITKGNTMQKTKWRSIDSALDS